MFTTFSFLFGPRGESLTSQRIIMDKQIDHDDHHVESKTRTRRLSMLSDDGDPWAPNSLLKSGEKQKLAIKKGLLDKSQSKTTDFQLFMMQTKYQNVPIQTFRGVKGNNSKRTGPFTIIPMLKTCTKLSKFTKPLCHHFFFSQQNFFMQIPNMSLF